MQRNALPTVLLYTEEARGNLLVESPVVGMISDIIGTRKFVVIRDVFNHIDYVYKISSAINNLDAVSISRLDASAFDEPKRILIGGDTHKLAPATVAFKLLNGQDRWIQDKGSILSVLLHGAMGKAMDLVTRTIDRPRVTQIPSQTPVEYIPLPESDDSQDGITAMSSE